MKEKTTAAVSSTVGRLVGASFPHNVLVSGLDENGSMVDIELRLYDLAITVNGYCKIYSPNVDFQRRRVSDVRCAIWLARFIFS